MKAISRMKTEPLPKKPSRSPAVRFIEGVPYRRFIVRFTLATGKRRRIVRWSPGAPWVFDEVGRELEDRFGSAGIKPRSVTIVEES